LFRCVIVPGIPRRKFSVKIAGENYNSAGLFSKLMFVSTVLPWDLYMGMSVTTSLMIWS